MFGICACLEVLALNHGRSSMKAESRLDIKARFRRALDIGATVKFDTKMKNCIIFKYYLLQLNAFQYISTPIQCKINAKIVHFYNRYVCNCP